MWPKLLAILTLQFAFLLADGMAQNAGMRCEEQTGANKSVCLKPLRRAAQQMQCLGWQSKQRQPVTFYNVAKRA